MCAETTRRPGRVTHGGHDRLAQHLAPLDNGPPAIGPWHAFPGQLAGLAEIHHVDEMRGVAPCGEPLDRRVPAVLPGQRVDHFDADVFRIECPVTL